LVCVLPLVLLSFSLFVICSLKSAVILSLRWLGVFRCPYWQGCWNWLILHIRTLIELLLGFQDPFLVWFYPIYSLRYRFSSFGHFFTIPMVLSTVLLLIIYWLYDWIVIGIYTIYVSMLGFTCSLSYSILWFCLYSIDCWIFDRCLDRFVLSSIFIDGGEGCCEFSQHSLLFALYCSLLLTIDPLYIVSLYRFFLSIFSASSSHDSTSWWKGGEML
jgi:hypothetical protein